MHIFPEKIKKADCSIHKFIHLWAFKQSINPSRKEVYSCTQGKLHQTSTNTPDLPLLCRPVGNGCSRRSADLPPKMSPKLLFLSLKFRTDEWNLRATPAYIKAYQPHQPFFLDSTPLLVFVGTARPYFPDGYSCYAKTPNWQNLWPQYRIPKVSKLDLLEIRVQITYVHPQNFVFLILFDAEIS